MKIDKLALTKSPDHVFHRVLPDKTIIRQPDCLFQSESSSPPIWIKTVRSLRTKDSNTELNKKRKVIWTHKEIQTSRVNLARRDNKAANSQTAKDRNANASSASGKSKAASRAVVASKKEAAKRVAVSKGNIKGIS